MLVGPHHCSPNCPHFDPYTIPPDFLYADTSDKRMTIGKLRNVVNKAVQLARANPEMDDDELFALAIRFELEEVLI